MSSRLEAVLEFLRTSVIEPLGRAFAGLARGIGMFFATAWGARGRIAIALGLGVFAYALYEHPPYATARRGEVLVRTNLIDGSASAYTLGAVLALPGIHQVRVYSTRDQVYRPVESSTATGSAPFQSNEGLSIGVDLTVRWAIDRARIGEKSREFPDDLEADLVQPAVQGVVYPLFAQHTVRDIFSDRRAQIEREITAALAPKLTAVGLVLRGVEMGKVDLPPDYRAGMERLLAEELETEKVARIRSAEGAAEARRIEARGEADSRQKLAEAEAYRLDLVGKANAGQMEREGAAIAHYPLLIQKTLADKLSDKVQVIIAPTPAAGQFIGSSLLGTLSATSPTGEATSAARP